MADIQFLDIIDSCLATSSRILARNITRIYDASLQPIGLNINQLGILLTVQGLSQELSSQGMIEYPRVTLIATKLGMDISTLSRNLRNLEGQGLITLENTPESRRVKEVRLTKNGFEIINQAFPLWQKIHEKLRNELDESVFKDLVAQISDANVIVTKLMNEM